MHKHMTQYTFGDTIYLKTDVNQEQWMVTDIFLHPNSVCVYSVVCGHTLHTAYEFEMSKEPNNSKKLGL